MQFSGGCTTSTTPKKGAKRPPISFTNVGLSLRNFLTFSFSPFTLVSNFKVILSASLKLLNLNQDHRSKNWFFWSNRYKIELILTSLVEMLLTKFWPHDQIYNIIWVTWYNFVGDVIVNNYDVIAFILKYLCFMKA